MNTPPGSTDKNKAPIKKSYLKYASLGYEMATLMLIAVFLGRYLDNHFENEKKLITATLVIVFMGAYMYKLIRDLANDSKNP